MRSDRFTVALCTCRRSRAYPWCDTSHRHRAKGSAAPGGDSDHTRGPSDTSEESHE
ncbi:CDGSH iron-sulfur domain-containing protein [Streptomyces niveus]|uniref:CDGSH iron-sulfur domain-containing protein n=1 Tax=Streptomyces niveus TaxID=193462 RepID=UPI0037145109